jgi:multidrug efflux system outer membrane protein
MRKKIFNTTLLRILLVYKLITIYLCTILLTGCAVKPKTLSFDDHDKRVKQDLAAIYTQDDAVPSYMTMEMAMARALKYNLILKTQAYNTIVNKKQLEVSNYAMWPQLLGSLGYFSRSNDNASSSQSLNQNNTTGDGSPSYSVSSSKSYSNASLQFSWNLLDFGTSYITAKQNADKYLIEIQRYRKALQNILRDVRSTYWQAYTAQEVEKDLFALMEEVKKAISNSNAASNQRINPELDNLTYRRSLFEILRNLKELQRGLIEAKTNLNALLVMPSKSTTTLRPKTRELEPIPKDFPMELQVLEKIALYDRPELREADYSKRISYQDVNKAKVQMLPSVSVGYGANYDSNKYLLNSSWAVASAQLSWNLMRLFSAKSTADAAKIKAESSDAERMALSVIILTQVDVAYYRYREAADELNVNGKLLSIDEKIQKQMFNMYKNGATDELSLIRSKANTILSKLRRNLAYAEWQNAGGQLLSSIGYDIVPDINLNANIHEISKEIEIALNTVPKTSQHLSKPQEKAMTTTPAADTTTKPEMLANTSPQKAYTNNTAIPPAKTARIAIKPKVPPVEKPKVIIPKKQSTITKPATIDAAPIPVTTSVSKPTTVITPENTNNIGKSQEILIEQIQNQLEKFKK